MRVALTTAIFILFSVTSVSAKTPAAQIPRTADGKPALNGFWQVLNTADWDLESQGGGAAPKEGLMLGAVSAIPPGLGVVEGGKIPYQPWALAKRNENRKNWPALDTEVQCLLPGIPRANYLPYPFQIIQYKDRMMMLYQYSYARREIYMTKREAPIDQIMGWSYGHWEGDTLVVDVTDISAAPELEPGRPVRGDWLDRMGNFYSE